MQAAFLLVGDQPYSRLMVQSLKQLKCPIIQMSDLKTPKVEGVDEVVRIPFRVPLTCYRLKHLAEFPHDEMLIVDTDVICKGQIGDVWESEFDVAVTARDPGVFFSYGKDVSKDMPYNTGVMFSRSQSFWKDCLAWLSDQNDGIQQWYGDQLAVAAVSPRYSVKSLPCSEFNWSPNSRQDSSQARFWHYKGAVRKKWLTEQLAPS